MSRRKRANASARNLEFANLESRCLLAGVTFNASSGVLTIEGGVGNENVRVLIATANSDQLNVIGTLGQHSFDASLVSQIQFFGNEGNDVFRNTTSLPSYAEGNDGADHLFGGSVQDEFIGGDGNDRLFGFDGGDLLTGGIGDDYIDTGFGLDNMSWGNEGNDHIVGVSGKYWGGSGDDYIRGKNGDFEIRGGDGNDVLIGSRPANSARIFGENGNDKIEVEARSNYVVGGNGDDEIMTDFSQPLVAYGNAGDDTIRGHGYLNGGPGSNHLIGHGTIYGGNDNDLIDIYSPTAESTVYGLSGDDVINSNGFSTIYAGAGDDVVTGKGGLFILGSGNDRALIEADGPDGNIDVRGDAGNDSINVKNGQTVVANGGDGNDTIRLSNESEISSTAYGGAGNDLLIGDANVNRLFGQDGNDRLFGYGQDDLLRGGTGNDVLFGGDGNDRLLGESGADTLRGENGDDDVIGGDNNDRAYGGNGNDLLTGDGGHDWLYGQDGRDQINGGLGHDRLYGGNHNDTLLGESGWDRLFGEHGNDVLSGGDHNDYLNGGVGNDILRGGNHNDNLYGENGADQLFGEAGSDGLFGGVGGQDRLTGGAHPDRLLFWAGDNLVDYGSADAAIQFKNVDSAWTNAEIAVIDEGFERLQFRTSTQLLRDSLDKNPVVYEKVNELAGLAIARNSLSMSYRYNVQTGQLIPGSEVFTRSIQFEDWNESSDIQNKVRVETTIHEIGHSWDSTYEIANGKSSDLATIWNSFLAISGWTFTDPGSDSFTQANSTSEPFELQYNSQTNSQDQIVKDWWRRNDAVFAVAYGSTSPKEDWATVWESIFNTNQDNANRVPQKVNLINQFFDAF